MEKFRKTLAHLQTEQIITSEQVALCLTIPLSKTRFMREKDGVNWWGRLFGHSIDFARRVAENFEPWWENDEGKGYKHRVVIPVLTYITDLRETTRVAVFPDITLEKFREIMTDTGYRFVILVAHHYQDRIEFAGGGIRIDKVEALFSKAFVPVSVSYYFLVCEAGDLGEKLYKKGELFSQASSDAEIPVVPALHFLSVWIQELDGSQTLSQAYHAALSRYVSFYQP